MSAARWICGLIAVAAAAAALTGCGAISTSIIPGASASRGRQLIEQVGCGACHTISGIPAANGHVGPPLENFTNKRTIAGVLPNTPDAVSRWIQSPQSIRPNTFMPDLGISPRDAQDIVAYLYTQ